MSGTRLSSILFRQSVVVRWWWWWGGNYSPRPKLWLDGTDFYISNHPRSKKRISGFDYCFCFAKREPHVGRRRPSSSESWSAVCALRPSISIISHRNESSHCLCDGAALASRKAWGERNMCLWIMTCRLILLAFDSGGTLGTALINPAWEGRGGGQSSIWRAETKFIANDNYVVKCILVFWTIFFFFFKSLRFYCLSCPNRL